MTDMDRWYGVTCLYFGGTTVSNQARSRSLYACWWKSSNQTGRNTGKRCQQTCSCIFHSEKSCLYWTGWSSKQVPAIGKTRESIMQALQKSHTGLRGCLRRAREVVFWPGLHTDLEKFLSQCEPCQTLKIEPNQRTTSDSSDTRHVKPYQRSISVISLEDFFFLRLDLMDYAGKGYLVTVDYSSNFFEVDGLQDKAAEEVI